MKRTLVYDPADPDFSAHARDIYKTLRDDYPVYSDPQGRFVALSRFEHVREASLDWERFSSTGKVEATVTLPTLSSFDPPRHGQLRAILARAFTPRRVTELEPEVRQIARDLVDVFADRGNCDAMLDYAALLPSMVMGKLLGLPDELVPVCRELTDASKRRRTPTGAADATHRSYEIFAELYDERRAEPGDDLLTALLHANIGGERLSQDDLLAFGWLLLVGGFDTTTNLIGNGIELLARDHASRAALVADPSLLPGAIEEMLRYVSPTHALPRRATVDIELEGGTIPEGSRVNLLWHAANLDEREFPEPDRFDIHRNAPRHLALGHGPHFCMGAALARLEGRIAFEEFLRRVPDYELAAEPERLVSITFNGFERIPLRF